MKISIIVITYNRPEALYLCLLSLSKQTMLPDNVIVADDGSRDETRDLISQFKKSDKCFFNLKHVWQEDKGFRKPKIINEAVRNCDGDYLIFIDGDCMAHKNFIRAHVEYSEPMAILGGKRVELGEKITKNTLDNFNLMNSLNFNLFWDSIVNDSRKCEEAFQIKAKFLRRLLKRDRITNDGIWGCNFSLYKNIFYEINGSDEDFLDGSLEDNDLGIRVLNLGGKVKSVRALAIIFHIWHETSWSFESKKYVTNKNIIERRIALKECKCANGINKFNQANP